MTIVLFILILGAIIFVHELGHFLFAKMFKVYVHEFALGMGPKLWSKKGKETEYTLRAIPIGGFCQLAGESGEDEEDLPEDRLLYGKKPWQRFLIMVCGAVFNFVLAIILLFFIGLIWGSSSYKPIIADVEKNMPAYKAGVEANNKILAINGNRVSTMDDVTLFLTLANREKPVTMKVEKEDGAVETYKFRAKKVEVDGEESYRFGINLETEKQTGFVNAVKYTFVKTGSIFRQMWYTVSNLFTGGIKLSQLSGPVGIYSIVGEQSKQGFANLLYLTALLSINVGFINLLPIPAFDGGRVLFLVIEKIKGSPVNPKTEGIIHAVGLALLMLLMVYITFQDIRNLFF